MRLYEMLIDEEQELSGVNALSLVENPAIQSDWIALSDEKKVLLAKVSEDKQILMGAALIPDKPIYRNQNGEEFYIYFSKETVAKAAEMFFKRHNQNNATLEHESPLEGMTVFESWIVNNPEMDKSRAYGLDVPEGTWVVSMKVDDANIWNDFVKNNKVFGFSIEGQFATAVAKENYDSNLSDQQLEKLLTDVADILLEYQKHELETYNDYPESAVNNAKKVIKWKEEHGDEVNGMTQIGWTRANQLAKKEKLSRSTIARMASFKRHEKNAEINPEYEATPWKDAGYVAWLGWGGASGVNWAINKLKTIDGE